MSFLILPAMNGLTVCYGELDGSGPCDDGGLGWRVQVIGIRQSFGMKFLRQRDAESAMHAIKNFTDWTASEDEIRASIMPRAQELRSLMVSNLAW